MNKLSTYVYDKLKQLIPNPQTELNYSSTFELLVAVILSAQCTDKRVNEVTSKLFKVASTPYDFVNMSQEELENHIHSCGFYRNKARNIKSMSADLIAKFDGQVPRNYDELVSLSGVGTKTANVMLAVGFGKPGLAVDTHVHRVSSRLKLSNAKSPENQEKELKKIFPQDKWGEVHHLLLLFGRYYCTARNPKCEGCVLKDKCKFKGVK